MSICNVNFSSSSSNTAFSSEQRENLLSSRTVITSASRGVDIVSSCPAAPPAPILGICGQIESAQQGNLLSPVAIQQVSELENTVLLGDPFGEGKSFSNSKQISFTAIFMREFPAAVDEISMVIDLQNQSPSARNFAFYMNSDGYMKIEGLNAAGTKILDVLITNNGATFAISNLHGIAVTIDLTDVTKREIRLNNLDITENSAYVTWNTYTDDLIDLEDDGGSNRVKYGFGLEQVIASAWGVSNSASGFPPGIDALGFITFDDACSLVPKALWNDAGWYRDPGKWEGWYITQPQVFFGHSFWRNTGKTEPSDYDESNNLEKTFNVVSDGYGGASSHLVMDPRTILNRGIGAIIKP